MTPRTFTISGARVLLDDGLAPATITVDGARGVIVRMERARRSADIDAGDMVVMPGVVDTHVHVNEPGRTEWEGFATAGRAAAAGGVTSMVVMPLNCEPAAVTVPALMGEVEAARASCIVDHGFWGGVVPEHLDDLAPLWHAGVLGFKCFLVHAGVDDFPNVSARDLDDAMVVLRNLAEGGAPLLVHAEDPDVIAAARGLSGLDQAPRSYAAYLASRPAEAEVTAIEGMIDLCARHRARVHIVHVATGRALNVLTQARRAGLPITAETCPHYLSLCAEDVTDGATQFKCAPPIRERRTREALWDALRAGVLDLIASDHSPCPPALKQPDTGDFARAWGGIAGLQLTLPVVWTEAHARGLDMADVAGWLCRGPAALAGLSARKGRLAEGHDADIVVFDDAAEWTVDGARLHHRHPVTPYHGRHVRGRVCATLVRGVQVFGDGCIAPAPGATLDASGLNREHQGQWLKRTP